MTERVKSPAYIAAVAKAKTMGYASLDDAIAALRAQGLSNVECGQRLGVAKSTFIGWCATEQQAADAKTRKASAKARARINHVVSLPFYWEFPDEPHSLSAAARDSSRSTSRILDRTDRIWEGLRK